jgi:hypothetical protein
MQEKQRWRPRRPVTKLSRFAVLRHHTCYLLSHNSVGGGPQQLLMDTKLGLLHNKQPPTPGAPLTCHNNIRCFPTRLLVLAIGRQLFNLALATKLVQYAIQLTSVRNHRSSSPIPAEVQYIGRRRRRRRRRRPSRSSSSTIGQ